MDDYQEKGNCAMCGGAYNHFGNNPEPIFPFEKRVCDVCNAMFVTPTRMQALDVKGAKTIAGVLKGRDVRRLVGLWQMLLTPRPSREDMEKVIPFNPN